ncbi:cytochrome P450 [Dactylonectria macrodidyma]|uniref:Cytochrome P450 n=1 Tax=Dactylonectria macrodidyma TaxID=307937 RepID=A0A9P9CZZ3_9HYPO|nr:cytochrome P450 [Dactylonectria macrodidyma]
MCRVLLLPVIAGLVVLLFGYTGSSHKGKPIPGPPKLPLVGNLLQIKSPTIFKKWARDPQVVKDLLEKQSAVTSTRPSFLSARIVSGDRRMVLMPYGSKWRTLRSIIHPLLTQKAASLLQPAQEFESKQLLWDIYKSTKNTDQGKKGKDEREMSFATHVRRYSASVVLTMVYGIRASTWESNAIAQIFEVMDDFGRVANPVYCAIDVFPWLLNLPKWMHWWQKELRQLEERQNKTWLLYWNQMKDKIDRGDAPDCFGRQFVEAGYHQKGISELQAAYVCGTMIEAGSDTTAATVNNGLLYLSAYPDVIAKAHEEIERVVGSSRSPTFTDQLPYVRAIVKEALRIRPATTVGGPHGADKDIEYKGYIIPKGTALILHQNGIHMDSEVYPEPESFQPERFLGHPLKAGDYVGISDPYKRDHWTYGTGRRICSGMHVAENSLHIVFARILWAFKILPPVDDNGVNLPVDLSDDAFVLGAVTMPKPYKCRFIPRNSQVEETLVREWKAAEAEGFWLGDRKVGRDGILASSA